MACEEIGMAGTKSTQAYGLKGDTDVEKGMKIAIERAVVKRLKRGMTPQERERILKPRPLVGYETILEFLRDENKSVGELEEYLQSAE